MNVQEAVMDGGVRASPSLAWLSTYATAETIPVIVSILTGTLVLLQIYKTLGEIRAAKRKEKLECKRSIKD